MAQHTETIEEPISKKLGAIRRGLIAEGFTEHDAGQVIFDLVRRGQDWPAVLGPVPK